MSKESCAKESGFGNERDWRKELSSLSGFRGLEEGASVLKKRTFVLVGSVFIGVRYH